MPSLFIVVDEFSEMLSAKPEFIDLFVAIGRLGRSLGLHLLLASQRLEEGRLRGLESHLSYRVGLRTFSATESRSVLGVPDAYELPADPRPRLPQARPDDDAAVQGGLRLRAAVRPGAGTPRRGRPRPRHPAVHDLRGAEPRPARARRPEPEPSPSRRRASSESLLDDRRATTWSGHGPAGPPGLAAAARRARHPRRADARPRRRPAARPGLAASGARSAGSSSRSAPSTGRASSAATPSPSTSAAPAATSPSSAARAAARARCCARSSPACR